MKNYLNKIFNVKNIPFTIGWIIGIGLSLPIIKQIEPEKPIVEIFTYTFVISQLFELLIFLTIMNYFNEILDFISELFYVVKHNCINIYKEFIIWLNKK